MKLLENVEKIQAIDKYNFYGDSDHHLYPRNVHVKLYLILLIISQQYQDFFQLLHILDTILVHCILHILGTILVHCLI